MFKNRAYRDMFLVAWLLVFVFVISGCDSMSRGYEYKSGKEISYCVVEDTPPSRLLCVNSRLTKENPLFGVKQGEFPYTSATEGNFFNYCYCNPDLVTLEENRQQGKPLEIE